MRLLHVLSRLSQCGGVLDSCMSLKTGLCRKGPFFKGCQAMDRSQVASGVLCQPVYCQGHITATCTAFRLIMDTAAVSTIMVRVHVSAPSARPSNWQVCMLCAATSIY
jgi:hypothetical protein